MIKSAAYLRGYMRARNLNNMHAVVLRRFAESGLTEAEIAERTGHDLEIIEEFIGTGCNATLDLISDVLFVLGSEMAYGINELPPPETWSTR